MKIEVLFPEVCNLYGDLQNINYLKKCLPEAEFINTSLGEEPVFATEKIEFIYLGPMTEKTQEKVIQKLLPYKSRIEELIESNTVFLFTGNAMEVLGKYIENEDGTKIDAIGIFDVYAKRDMFHRYFGAVLGKLSDIDIVGFKTTFSFTYGENENNYFIKVNKGIGINKQSKLEGVRKNNFIGTYLIGPILITNPLFTKYLIELMGEKNPKLAFEEEILDAYQERLLEFKSDKIK